MKKYMLLIFICCSSVIYTQNYNEIDGLKKKLLKAQADTTRIYLMNAIAFDYFETNPDSALYFTERALELSKKVNYSRGEARSLMNLGHVFRTFGNFPKSLEMQYKALQLCESIGDKHQMASAYTNIAFTYSEHGDYRQAIDYQFKSLKIDEELKNNEYLAVDYLNLGDGYEKLNKLDSALHFENKAYEMALEYKLEEYLSVIQQNLGNIHLKLGNNDIALPFYRRAVYYGKKMNNYLDICYSYFGMVDLFEKTGRKDSSIFYADKAFKEASAGNLSLEKLTASTHLANLYENKNKDSTLKYLKLSVVLKDSLFNQEKIKQLQNLTFAEKIRQKEIAEAKAEEELNQRNTLQMYAIAIFIVLFIILVFIFSRLKINIQIVEWLGIFAILLTFNFISMLLHTVIKKYTYMPVLMFTAVAVISLILKPLHNKVTELMNKKLLKKNKTGKVKTISEENKVINNLKEET